jgi:hypothetical protein
MFKLVKIMPETELTGAASESLLNWVIPKSQLRALAGSGGHGQAA